MFLCASLVVCVCVCCLQSMCNIFHTKGVAIRTHTHSQTHTYTYPDPIRHSAYKLVATFGACSTVLRLKIFPFWQGKYFCKTELNRFCFTAPIGKLIFVVALVFCFYHFFFFVPFLLFHNLVSPCCYYYSLINY